MGHPAMVLLMHRLRVQLDLFGAAAIFVFTALAAPTFTFRVEFEVSPAICGNPARPESNPSGDRIDLPYRIRMHVVDTKVDTIMDSLSRFSINQPLGLLPSDVFRQEDGRLSENLRHWRFGFFELEFGCRIHAEAV